MQEKTAKEDDKIESSDSKIGSELKEDLEVAYMNDKEKTVIIENIDYSDDDRKIVVDFKTKYGDHNFSERYISPQKGSLSECEEFMDLLDFIGVSPMDVEEAIGKEVPGVYEDYGWRIDLTESKGTISRSCASIRNKVIENKEMTILFLVIFAEFPIILFILMLA